MKESSRFYDLNPILSKKDINGKTPKLLIITTNRLAGKSHALEEHVLSFLRKGKYRKIAILCRHKTEIDGAAERFFSVSDWMHEGLMYRTGKKYNLGYADIILNEENVGYVLALSAIDGIKMSSGLLKDIDCVIWDEFQREDNRYLPNEATLFQSLKSSICRGYGSQERYCRFILASNHISLLSPILSDLEIEKRLMKNTKYVRGDGFVFEQSINLYALEAQKRTLGSSRSSDRYAGGEQVIYLNDSKASIGKPSGRGRYCETFKDKDGVYAIYYYADENKFYVSLGVDKQNKNCYTKIKNEVDGLFVVANHTLLYRRAFEKGRFTFENLECKSALIRYISYGCN